MHCGCLLFLFFFLKNVPLITHSKHARHFGLDFLMETSGLFHVTPSDSSHNSVPIFRGPSMAGFYHSFHAFACTFELHIQENTKLEGISISIFVKYSELHHCSGQKWLTRVLKGRKKKKKTFNKKKKKYLCTWFPKMILVQCIMIICNRRALEWSEFQSCFCIIAWMLLTHDSQHICGQIYFSNRSHQGFSFKKKTMNHN